MVSEENTTIYDMSVQQVQDWGLTNFVDAMYALSMIGSDERGALVKQANDRKNPKKPTDDVEVPVVIIRLIDHGLFLISDHDTFPDAIGDDAFIRFFDAFCYLVSFFNEEKDWDAWVSFLFSEENYLKTHQTHSAFFAACHDIYRKEIPSYILHTIEAVSCEGVAPLSYPFLKTYPFTGSWTVFKKHFDGLPPFYQDQLMGFQGEEIRAMKELYLQQCQLSSPTFFGSPRSSGLASVPEDEVLVFDEEISRVHERETGLIYC